MATLRNCIDWNSNAVALLQAGKKEEAANTIKKSLRCLESLSNESQGNAISSGILLETSTRLPSIHGVPVEHNAAFNSPSNLFSFYPRMIDMANADNLGISKVLVVLLYNLAVLSHIEITSQEIPSSDRLTECLGLYETAMKVAHTSWSSQDAQEMLLVLLALTNNVGHIHSHLLDFQRTRESLSLQKHLLARISKHNRLPLEDYEVFFESVCVFLDGLDLHLAPAA